MSAGFQRLRVAAFESRRAAEMTRLLERAGAVARVSPSMREVPLAGNQELVAYARRIIAGEVDVVILMTGVGLRLLLTALAGSVDQDAFVSALGRTTLVARGPKPVAALREIGLQTTHRVPEPNTWRDILHLLEQEVQLRGVRVAVHEYGQPNPDLIHGLEAQGAQVSRVRIYRWALPEDPTALEANLRAIAAGDADVLLFTSAQQVVNVVQTAERLGIGAAIRAATRRAVVASIGPTTSDALRAAGLPVDLQPPHPKMGQLVADTAARAAEALARKRAAPQTPAES